MRRNLIGIIFIIVTALVSSFSLASEQWFTMVNLDRFRDITSPFDNRHVVHFFGPAKPSQGEEINFPASGTIIINLYREVANLPGEVTVLVSTKNQDGVVLTEWVVKHNPLAVQKVIAKIEMPAEAHFLSVKVIDDAEGGPTGQRPYTITLEAWPITSESTIELPIAIVEAYEKEWNRKSEASCGFVEKFSKRADYLESFSEIRIDQLPIDVPVQYLVTAGGFLGIEFPSKSGSNDVMEIRLSAKHFGDGPFREVCAYNEIRGDSLQFLEAKLTKHDQYTIWRVEINIRNVVNADAAARLSLIRERLMSHPDPYRGNASWNNGIGLICFNRITQFLGYGNSTNAFSGRTKLNIVTPTDKSIRLNPLELRVVEDTLLQAASLWVYSCLVCKPDNLSVISINKKTFVKSILFELIFAWNNNSYFFDSVKVEEQLRDFLGTSRVGIAAPFLPYKQVDLSSKKIYEFCSIPKYAGITPVLNRVQSALCDPSDDTSANIRVSFNNNGTACGNDSDIVGCWVDHELTQFNVRDYSFINESKSVTVGNGKINLDLLQAVVHEMGHWIGLDHVEKSDSIMSPTLEQARCIDFETVSALAFKIIQDSPGSSSRTPQAFRLRAKK